MAWTEFYIQTTGNNLNAGSTTADPALATSTNGSWDITANRFIAAGGATPFLSVTVGMYASIYLDAATSAVFVSKVTAVDVGGTYIEVSKTANKLGTAPASGATGRSCKVGGAWKDTAIVSLFPTAVTVDQSTRINIKSGAYTNANTAVNFQTAGATATPIWWRGYNTTPGDLDDYSALTKPAWTCTGTGRFTWTGAFQYISGLDITAAVANNSVALVGAHCHIHRCRVTNTTANAAASAISIASNSGFASCCYFSATSTATGVITTSSGASPSMWWGCIITGGGAGFAALVTSSVTILSNCLFRSIGGAGIAFSAITSGNVIINACTFYGCGSHGIDLQLVPTGFIQITNCNFWSITGYGINSGAGTCGAVFRAGNDFRSCSSGDENGLGDSPGAPGVSGATWGSQDEVSDPWTSATDMTPRIYSKAHQMALPRTFEYEPYNTYADVGAVNSQNAPAPTVGGHVARRT